PAARKFAVEAGHVADFVTLYHPQVANPVRVRLAPRTAVGSANPLPVELPVTVTGRLARPDDVNVYQFQAKKGQALSFAAEARTLGFPLEPVLRVTDAAGGKVLAQAQAGARALGTDPELAFAPPQDGS